LRVVYKDVESVGFGVIHPYVVGWYCPEGEFTTAILEDQITAAKVTVSADELAQMKAGALSISQVLEQSAQNDAN
jgi:hypothetical protein